MAGRRAECGALCSVEEGVAGALQSGDSSAGGGADGGGADGGHGGLEGAGHLDCCFVACQWSGLVVLAGERLARRWCDVFQLMGEVWLLYGGRRKVLGIGILSARKSHDMASCDCALGGLVNITSSINATSLAIQSVDTIKAGFGSHWLSDVAQTIESAPRWQTAYRPDKKPDVDG